MAIKCKTYIEDESIRESRISGCCVMTIVLEKNENRMMSCLKAFLQTGGHQLQVKHESNI